MWRRVIRSALTDPHTAVSAGVTYRSPEERMCHFEQIARTQTGVLFAGGWRPII